MKSTAHGIYALIMAIVAGICVFTWAINGGVTPLIFATIFYVFSAEHSIISVIKRKEDE